jgi:hypothetical protein
MGLDIALVCLFRPEGVFDDDVCPFEARLDIAVTVLAGAPGATPI